MRAIVDMEWRRQERLAWRGVPERLGMSFAQGNVEMRAKPNGTAAGSNFEWNGYAAVYGVEFDMWDRYGEPYKEHVEFGVSKRSLDNPNLDVPFLIGHNDAGIPMARTKSGTLKLAEDTTGLHTHVPEMDGRREDVRALASAVERGDMDEMSLAFVTTRQEWDANFERRAILEWELHRGDVCAVVHGANSATAGASMFPVEQLTGRRPVAIGGPILLGEHRAAMSAADQNDLPDSAFAYIEPGGTKDSGGKTTPRSLRHFPVHDAAHVRNALARAPQSPFGDKAMPAIRAAAKKFGVDVAAEHAAAAPYELRASAAEDMNLASSADYDAAAAGHAPMTGTHAHAHTHVGDAHVATSATMMVDDSTGIAGPETQFAAGAKLEIMRRQLELEELAAAR